MNHHVEKHLGLLFLTLQSRYDIFESLYLSFQFFDSCFLGLVNLKMIRLPHEKGVLSSVTDVVQLLIAATVEVLVKLSFNINMPNYSRYVGTHSEKYVQQYL